MSKNKKLVCISIDAEVHNLARTKVQSNGGSLSRVIEDFLTAWTADVPRPEPETTIPVEVTPTSDTPVETTPTEVSENVQ